MDVGPVAEGHFCWKPRRRFYEPDVSFSGTGSKIKSQGLGRWWNYVVHSRQAEDAELVTGFRVERESEFSSYDEMKKAIMVDE